MSFYPRKVFPGERAQTDVPGVVVSQANLVHFQVLAASATVASTTGIHAAMTDNGGTQVVTTGITQPSVTRALSVTAGGTNTDIKAISVTVTGTNYLDEVITEAIGPFTVDTAGTVQGAKAFKTVTSISIPAHDGTGATTAVGFNEVLGLPYKLTSALQVLSASRNNVFETTRPTVAVSSTAIESNTVDLNSALNSTVVDVLLAPYST